MSGGIVSIMAGASAFVGVAVGLTIGLLQNKRLRRRNRELRAALQTRNDPAKTGNEQVKIRNESVKTETMKLVVWVCLAMGIAWVWCSYILAYLDHPQIAESLSQVAVTEIIGVVLAYAIKSSIENLSKHNRWPDRGDPPEATAPDETGGEEGGGVG